MTSVPSLDAVAQDFEAWRSTKKISKERTPLALCIAAPQLCPIIEKIHFTIS